MKFKLITLNPQLGMLQENHLPAYNWFTYSFKEDELESSFKSSYNLDIKLPLRFGIIISIISWFSGIGLIYYIIPDKLIWLSGLTIIYIGSLFGFIIYATYKKSLLPYYHVLGAISNAWAGLFAIYFCQQFPTGQHLILPVLIFIVFFGSYLIHLRWLAIFITGLSYTLAYQVYILNFSSLESSQVILYSFVMWMTLMFAVLASRVTEKNSRISFIQRKTIREQNVLISQEKEFLLKEVHHRVKNNLQLIVSLINMQLSTVNNKNVSIELKDIQRKVMSMSLVHQKMNLSDKINEISIQNYIVELIEYSKSDLANEINYSLNFSKEIIIDLETAIPLGLILNEIINSFVSHVLSHKHDLRFEMEVKQMSNNIIKIECQDNVDNTSSEVDIKNTNLQGFELIQMLAEQIDGSFEISRNNGNVYKLFFTRR